MDLSLLLALALNKKKPAPPPPPTLDVSHYVVDLELDAKTGAFTSKTTVKFTPSAATKEVVLDSSGLEVSAATMGEGGAAAEVSLAKQPSGDDLLTLKLPVELPAGQPAELRLTAKGKASEGGDLGLLKQADPESPERVLYYTMFEPTGARRVFPCHDSIDDKATFQVSVTTDAELTVLSNGEKVSDEKLEGDGPARHKVTYKQEHPGATYLTGIVVGKFDLAEAKGTPPLGLYLNPGEKGRGTWPLSVTAKGLASVADFVGVPYPWARYDQVAIPAFLWGGVENTSLSLVRRSNLIPDSPEDLARQGHRVEVIDHELAHQWAGDLVTPASWADVWLSESLATYLGYQAELDYSKHDRAVVEALLSRKDVYYPAEDGPRSRAVAAPVADPKDSFDGIAYYKGFAVLRMLEAHLGREVLRKGLKAYFEAHPYGSASTDDFFADLEKASGKSLGAFKQAWLREPGYPVIKVVTHWLPADNQLVITLTQRPNKAGKPVVFSGTMVAVAHRTSEPAYNLEVPLILDQKEVTIGAQLPAEPEWINFNKGAAFLGKLETSPKPEALQAEALKDTDPAARLWAQLELAGSLVDPEKKGAPAPAAVELLATALKSDRSPYVRSALLRELQRGPGRALPGPLAEAAMAQAVAPADLPDDEPGLSELKGNALALLGKAGTPAAGDLLAKQIKKTDLPLDLLEGTARGLGVRGDATAVGLLKAALASQGGRGFAYKRAVLNGLASSESEAVVPVLLEELRKERSSSELVRNVLYVVQGNLPLARSAAGVGLAEAVASDGGFNDELRAHAVRLLDPVKTPAAKAALGKLAKSDNPRVAALAKQTLQKNFR